MSDDLSAMPPRLRPDPECLPTVAACFRRTSARLRAIAADVRIDDGSLPGSLPAATAGYQAVSV